MEVILHRAYGGFHITHEMGLWLEENKNWKIIKHSELKNHANDENKNHILIEYPGSRDYLSTFDYHFSNTVEFRSDPDFVNCVKYFQDKYKDVSRFDHKKYHERYYHDLSIEDICIKLEIEDYNDGYERITYGGGYL